MPNRTTPLWSTGVDDHGNTLRDGSPDPHWWVVRGPGIDPLNPPHAVVLADQRIGTYFLTSTSKWIGVDAAATGDPSDYYVYRMKFLLELDFTQVWVRITGQWSADNYGEIRLDGHPLPAGAGGGETSLASLATGGSFLNYDQPHDFSITQQHFPAVASASHLQLNAGWHSLDFWVHNEGAAGASNPSGLNVFRMAIEINPVRQFPSPTGVAQRLGP
jgi:hypothetical protein